MRKTILLFVSLLPMFAMGASDDAGGGGKCITPS